MANLKPALAYYYENKDRLDAEIEQRYENAEQLSRQSSEPNLRRKLLELKSRR